MLYECAKLRLVIYTIFPSIQVLQKNIKIKHLYFAIENLHINRYCECQGGTLTYVGMSKVEDVELN